MSERQVIVIGVVLTVILISVGIYGDIAERKEWSKFSELQECVVVGHVKGTMSPVTTIGTNGQVGVGFVSEEAKTTYKCNDGKTYTR